MSILPIAAGIMLGCLFSVLAMRVYTGILGDLLYFPMHLRSPPGIILGAVFISLTAVLVSAAIPASRMARLTPVDAIRMQTDAAGKSAEKKAGSLC